jgi:7,8-dihydropterin-6-yl-methyl-4-(beta-D-ribofuranosyl)aminobenzene 5'-phosphate synthase
MPDRDRKLKPVDRVEILTVVDNYIDVLLPGSDRIIRPPLAKEGQIPEDNLLAEHGLALLITVHCGQDSHRVLLDTGYNPDTAIRNLKFLELDLKEVEAVVLSHGHMDHTGGVGSVLSGLSGAVPVMVHPDAFIPRFMALPNGERLRFPRSLQRDAIKQGKVQLKEGIAPVYLADHRILVSGQVPRITPFEKGMPAALIEREGEIVPDTFNDDQFLVMSLGERGLVVVSGCAHAGIINSLHYARELTGQSRIYAVVGGFHLTGPAMEPAIEPTLEEMKKISPEVIVPMHCTGSKAISRFAEELPEAFVLNSVGSTLTLAGTSP